MDALYQMFPEEKEEFPWDERALIEFKTIINENGLNCRMDDIFLLGFLRVKRFNLEKSLELLKNYYFTRINYPMYYKNLFPSKLEKRWDPSEVDVLDVFRLAFLLSDLMLNLHRTQVNGMVAIINSQGANIRRLLQHLPTFISSLLTNMHKDVTTLHKFIHPKYLPIAYGGELPDSDPREFIEIVKQNENFFRQNEEYVRMYDAEVQQIFSEETFESNDMIS
ncbi:alpha-tocopherol transfer protein-like [Centruroides vittatus]|uniref:alpha-tocopherol transfer protein-like n=1 Tax=Centruroides vittatus TaxID=120091 RepID=UPI003510ADBE